MLENLGRLWLRVVLGGLLLFHGVDKVIHGIAPIKRLLVMHHLPEFLAYGVYVGELLAPLFVIIGWKSRVWAGVIALNMLIAIYLTHSKSLWALGKHGEWVVELPVLYLAMAVAVMLLGSGKYAIVRD
jgi:putative oxidoreductase